MNTWFFVSDLHGQVQRYHKLLQAIQEQRPAVVLLGGDLLPVGGVSSGVSGLEGGSFLRDFVQPGFSRLKSELGEAYPSVFLILGNDDPRSEEANLAPGQALGLWTYIHKRWAEVGEIRLCGYACVPPTPFLLKDWELYDVSRFIDPGCISPEEGWRSMPVAPNEVRQATILAELEALALGTDFSKAVILFHSPPYRTKLDRAALDGRVIDTVPLDVHVGSIAIRRFVEARQPLVTLHGHIHESARISGAWQERIGRTYAFSAAHDGPELALVRFDPHLPEKASRELI
jgi:Icc-related predicted phosphoesterase